MPDPALAAACRWLTYDAQCVLARVKADKPVSITMADALVADMRIVAESLRGEKDPGTGGESGPQTAQAAQEGTKKADTVSQGGSQAIAEQIAAALLGNKADHLHLEYQNVSLGAVWSRKNAIAAIRRVLDASEGEGT